MCLSLRCGVVLVESNTSRIRGGRLPPTSPCAVANTHSIADLRSAKPTDAYQPINLPTPHVYQTRLPINTVHGPRPVSQHNCAAICGDVTPRIRTIDPAVAISGKRSNPPSTRGRGRTMYDMERREVSLVGLVARVREWGPYATYPPTHLPRTCLRSLALPYLTYPFLLSIDPSSHHPPSLIMQLILSHLTSCR